MKLKWWHLGLFLAILVAFLAPLASSSPDGLEKVAENKWFIDTAREAFFNVIPDYSFPGIHNEALATIIAGVIGTIVLFGLVYGLAWVVGRRSRKGHAE